MSKQTICIVQCGQEDWSKQVTAEKISLVHLHPSQIKDFAYQQQSSDNKDSFEALLLTDDTYPQDVLLLEQCSEVHAVFYLGDLATKNGATQLFLKRKLAQAITGSPEEVLHLLSKVAFEGQYGAKLNIRDMKIAKPFLYRSHYDGNRWLHFDDLNLSDFTPIAHFRYNISHDYQKLLSIWLEKRASAGLSVQLSIRHLPNGGVDHFINHWIISPEELSSPIDLDLHQSGYLTVTILAKGRGHLSIGPLHYRLSRGDFGTFLLGGERLCDHNGREIMTYFDPGDWQPPLNVYFSGYRPAEGFEGYFMMEKKGAPFLLIADPALEGGGFYLGSQEIEDKIKAAITSKLRLLGFSHDQLILSGLSMGTFGALYYSLELQPYAVVIGKPLTDLGTIAKGTKWGRPGEFATSLDLMQLLFGELNEQALEQANRIFWDKLETAGQSQTLLAVAYMKDDDYDSKAFTKLLEKGTSFYARIIGKGWSGRHNDNSPAIGKWFTRQYDDLLTNDFHRSDHK